MGWVAAMVWIQTLVGEGEAEGKPRVVNARIPQHWRALACGRMIVPTPVPLDRVTRFDGYCGGRKGSYRCNTYVRRNRVGTNRRPGKKQRIQPSATATPPPRHDPCFHGPLM